MLQPVFAVNKPARHIILSAAKNDVPGGVHVFVILVGSILLCLMDTLVQCCSSCYSIERDYLHSIFICSNTKRRERSLSWRTSGRASGSRSGTGSHRYL